MEKIKEIKELIYPASSVWSIISDISRCDWVPGVESIELEGNKEYLKCKEWVVLLKKYYLVTMMK